MIYRPWGSDLKILKLYEPSFFFLFPDCSSLRTLKEDLAKVSEEEELRVRKEETERLAKLRAKITLETEAEKEKIR